MLDGYCSCVSNIVIKYIHTERIPLLTSLTSLRLVHACDTESSTSDTLKPDHRAHTDLCNVLLLRQSPCRPTSALRRHEAAALLVMYNATSHTSDRATTLRRTRRTLIPSNIAKGNPTKTYSSTTGSARSRSRCSSCATSLRMKSKSLSKLMSSGLCG